MTDLLFRNLPCFFSYFVKSLEYFSCLLYQSKKQSKKNFPLCLLAIHLWFGNLYTSPLYIPMFTVICVSPGNVCLERISVVIFSSIFSNISLRSVSNVQFPGLPLPHGRAGTINVYKTNLQSLIPASFSH